VTSNQWGQSVLLKAEFVMPKAHPRELRDDVVAVARKGDAMIKQIAKNFGIPESCLRSWPHLTDVEDGRATCWSTR